MKKFRGGVMLAGAKLSSGQPIEILPEVEEVKIPLKMHIGAPALPVVETGDFVARGQAVARSDGEISADIHASISGRITEITHTYLKILREGTREKRLAPLSNPNADEIRRRVKEAGIVGMGGAGFPTHVKVQRAVKTLILNGAECEPYLTADDRLMREQTEKIVRGGKLLARAVNTDELFIGIEENKPEAIARFRATDLTVFPLKKRYPAGAEKQLIYAITGKTVPLGKLPADVGVCVQNVATAYAVAEAVDEGKPLYERIVTLAGNGIKRPANLLCPVGTPLSALVKFAGGKAENALCIMGGPMTGTKISESEAVVTKLSGGFLFLTDKEQNDDPPTPCINCGKCADVCPMRLMPMQIEFFTRLRNFRSAEKYGGVSACIQCGACSYICPARRPLAEAIRTAKREQRRKP